MALRQNGISAPTSQYARMGALIWLAGRVGHRVLARPGMRGPAVAEGRAGWSRGLHTGIGDVRFRARI
jgi:hypothetical protein